MWGEISLSDSTSSFKLHLTAEQSRNGAKQRPWGNYPCFNLRLFQLMSGEGDETKGLKLWWRSLNQKNIKPWTSLCHPLHIQLNANIFVMQFDIIITTIPLTHFDQLYSFSDLLCNDWQSTPPAEQIASSSLFTESCWSPKPKLTAIYGPYLNSVEELKLCQNHSTDILLLLSYWEQVIHFWIRDYLITKMPN